MTGRPIFTIGTTQGVQVSMGDRIDEIAIRTLNPYGGGPYPPAFATREAAEEWINGRPGYDQGTMTVVELVLHEQS